jgi:hypothetical protein
MKIYVDDPSVPYKTTKIDPLTTKSEIEGILARWGIKKVGWEWDLETGRVVLEFQYAEMIGNTPVSQWVKLQPPTIWNKPAKRPRYGAETEDSVNWSVSLRTMYWWLKTHMEMIHLQGYDKTTMLLPFIMNAEEKTLADVLVPKMTKGLLEVPALEDLRK